MDVCYSRYLNGRNKSVPLILIFFTLFLLSGCGGNSVDSEKAGSEQKVAELSDSAPDSFQFLDKAGVQKNTAVQSGTVFITGIDKAVPITVEGGGYRLGNSKEFVSEPGLVYPGQSVQLQVQSSDAFFSRSAVIVTIAEVENSFAVFTVNRDVIPDEFHYPTKINDLVPGSILTILDTHISGINDTAQVHINNGEYAINGGLYTDEDGEINNGDHLVVRTTTSSMFSATKVIKIVIGDKSASFSVTTKVQSDPDQSPDSFNFRQVSYTDLDELYTSESVQITGINTATKISILRGSYSINNGPFVSSQGSVVNNDWIRVRVQSSVGFAAATSANVSVGDQNASFVVTTLYKDISPDVLVFSAVTDALPNTSYTSNSVTITGINSSVPVSITGGQYQIGEAPFTSNFGYIDSGSTIKIKAESSADFGTTKTVTLQISNVDVLYKITTGEKDLIPDQFSFPNLTNISVGTIITTDVVNVTGINTEVDISIYGGEYSIDGGDFTDDLGKLVNGSNLALRALSSDEPSTKTNVFLTIGTHSVSFSITTQVADTSPDSFSFNDKVDVEPISDITSNEITITGINTATKIYVYNGTYSIDGGDFTHSNGEIEPGQTLRVKVHSANAFSTTESSYIRIGDVKEWFMVKTRAGDITPNPFSFTHLNNQKKNTEFLSNTAVISGLDPDGIIGIEDGEYSINGGDFTSDYSIIKNGDSIRVKLQSANEFNTPKTAKVTIGREEEYFHVTTDVEPKLEIASLKQPNLLGEEVAIEAGEELLAVVSCNDATHRCQPSDTQFRWFVDGLTEPVSTDQTYVIEDAYVNRTFTVEATPINLAGDAGTPVKAAVSRNKVDQVVGNDSAFAAIKTDGSVYTWGSKRCGGDVSNITGLENIVSITASSCAFAALKDDGSVIAWGDERLGGDAMSVQESLVNVREIIGSELAFSAIKHDGTIVMWGAINSAAPEPPSGIDVNNIVKVVSAGNQFAALSSDGYYHKLLTWGMNGDYFDDVKELLSGNNIVDIVASEVGFSAIYYGSIFTSSCSYNVVAWGPYASQSAAAGDSDPFYLPRSSCIHTPQLTIATDRAYASFGISYIDSWGPESQLIDEPYHSYDYLQASSTEKAIAVVYDERDSDLPESKGLVLTWGELDLNYYQPDAIDIQLPDGLYGVKSTVGNLGAFAAIKHDGTVVTWGDQNTGANSSGVQHQLQNVKFITATDRAFTAVTYDGEVISWGDPNYGGANQSIDFENTRFIDLASTYDRLGDFQFLNAAHAYAGISDSNKLITWGDSLYGGVLSEKIRDTDTFDMVEANVSAFAAYRSDGTIVSWGSFDRPAYDNLDIYSAINQAVEVETYELPIPQGVRSIHSTNHAFSALKEDASVISWGNASYGGDSDSVSEHLLNVKIIYSNRMAFAAMTNDGQVITWGHPDNGGDSSEVTNLLIDVKSIENSGLAFAALKNDGTVVAWGHPLFGGDASTVANELTAVKKLVSTESGFAALKENGEVINWGDDGSHWGVQFDDEYNIKDYRFEDRIFPSYYEKPSDLTNVVDIFSNRVSFFAVLSDGSIRAWGREFGGELKHIDNYALQDQESLVASGLSMLGITESSNLLRFSGFNTDWITPENSIVEIQAHDFGLIVIDDMNNQYIYSTDHVWGEKLPAMQGVSQIEGIYLLDTEGKAYNLFEVAESNNTELNSTASRVYIQQTGFDLTVEDFAVDVIDP